MIDPTAADIRRFAADDDGGPVVMLNLLRFADDDRAGYEAYAAATAPHLARVGASVVYAGLASTAVIAEPGQSWDAVVLVRYPSRQAFMAMVSDPDYRQISRMRTAALREAVLTATTPWLPG
jgi:uncharacterized protein (DUF1330 family)